VVELVADKLVVASFFSQALMVEREGERVILSSQGKHFGP
jgi:hypothetical protein